MTLWKDQLDYLTSYFFICQNLKLIYRQSRLYKGSLICDNIPLEIKQSENLGHFKHLLKNNTVYHKQIYETWLGCITNIDDLRYFHIIIPWSEHKLNFIVF